MTELQKITPYLWYDGQAEAAVDLYVSLFPNSRVVGVERIPSGPGEDGAIVEFELDGQRMIAFDGGPMFKFTEAVSFVVSCESQAEIDHYWYGLSEGGEEQQCGWLKDPFGLSMADRAGGTVGVDGGGARSGDGCTAQDGQD